MPPLTFSSLAPHAHWGPEDLPITHWSAPDNTDKPQRKLAAGSCALNWVINLFKKMVARLSTVVCNQKGCETPYLPAQTNKKFKLQTTSCLTHLHRPSWLPDSAHAPESSHIKIFSPQHPTQQKNPRPVHHAGSRHVRLKVDSVVHSGAQADQLAPTSRFRGDVPSFHPQ